MRAFFKKTNKKAKTLQLSIIYYSDSGKQIGSPLDITMNDIDTNDKVFFGTIPLNSKAAKAKVTIEQCILTDDTVVKYGD